jgi:hypothetical protein
MIPWAVLSGHIRRNFTQSITEFARVACVVSVQMGMSTDVPRVIGGEKWRKLPPTAPSPDSPAGL